MFISQQGYQLLKEEFLPETDESTPVTITEIFKATRNNNGVVCLDHKCKQWRDEEKVSFYSYFLLTKSGFDFIENLYTELVGILDDSCNLMLMVAPTQSVSISRLGTVLYDQPADPFALVYTSQVFNKENLFASKYFITLLDAINAVNALSSKMDATKQLLNNLKEN